MMPDYVPKDDPGKLLKFGDHNTWLTNFGAAHGFTPPEIAVFDASFTESSAAVVENVNKQTAARVATQDKKLKLADTEQRFRSNIQRLQSATTATPADIVAAGGNVRDTIRTPGDPNEIMTIPPPLLILDFSVRRQVTIHWGPNPSDERSNARPEGTLGVQISYARGGIPANEASWAVLDTDTESPYIFIVNEFTAISFGFRARYIGRNTKLGPLGDPVVCTVSV